MLSLRFVSDWESVWVVKEMIFWRGKASYLYSTVVAIWGSWRKLREHSDFLKDDSNGFGKIHSAQESLWEGFSKVVKASASYWSQSDSSLRNLNIVFRFRQLSSNSAKPPWPALCGFALYLELSNSPWFSLNNTMSRIGTKLYLLGIFRESGK